MHNSFVHLHHTVVARNPNYAEVHGTYKNGSAGVPLFGDGMDHQDYLSLSVNLPEIPIGATCFHTYFSVENRIKII